MKRIITVAIVGVLTLGLSALVYAETSTNTKPEKPKVSQSEKGGRGGFKLNLTKFVEDGTISQEQADKITALLDQKKVERQAEAEKIKNMTDEEKKAYFEANKTANKKVDFISELVSSEIITQAQADTINKTLAESLPKKDMRMGFKFDVTKVQEQLKTQVENGTITQGQSDKIVALFKQKAEEKEALAEKIKNMNDEEKKAYFEANKDSFKKKDVFSELVNSNIITQEQADTLSKVLFKGNDGKHRGKVDSSKDANTTTTNS